MLAHASCKPTEQAVNTFYPFLSLFFNALFFSAKMVSPLQHWFTLTWAGPARQGRGGTASYDSRCSASFSHQAYRSTMVSTPTAAFHHCKLSAFFLQLEEAILVYPQDFFVKVADVKHMYLYIPPSSNFKRIMFLHPLDLRQKLSHLCKWFLVETQILVFHRTGLELFYEKSVFFPIFDGAIFHKWDHFLGG